MVKSQVHLTAPELNSQLSSSHSPWHHYQTRPYLGPSKIQVKPLNLSNSMWRLLIISKTKKTLQKLEFLTWLTELKQQRLSIYIIQPHLNLSVCHSTSNSYHKTAKQKTKREKKKKSKTSQKNNPVTLN